MSKSFHDIFDKHAMRWRTSVTRFARAIWFGQDDEKENERYDESAIYFSREYQHELEKYYAEKGMKIWRGTLSGYVYEWLKQQDALKHTLKVIAEDKKNKLIESEIEKLKETKNPQAMIDKLYEAKKGETVYKVFSFKDNLKDLSAQYGEENAFELGSGINKRIIQHFSDRYFWRTQKDKRVRNTHQQLEGKCFLFSDPPTTFTKYGKEEKGNPGAISWGCRCMAEIAPEREKVLKNYIVYEKK